MKSGKLFLGLVITGLALAAIVGGAMFLTISMRERDRDRNMELARTLIGQSDFDRATPLLDEMIESGRGGEAWYPDVLALQLQLHEMMGSDSEARSTAQALLLEERGYRGEPVARAHLYLGQAALESGDAAAATPHFEAIAASSSPGGFGSVQAQLGLLRIRMASGGVSYEIQAELDQLAGAIESVELREEVEFVLGQCNTELLFSPAPGEDDMIYEVQRGDSIYNIARKHKVPQELLLKVNGITNPRRLSVSRRLKIPSVDFSIEVDKGRNTMTLLNKGKFFKRYGIRTGKVDYLTPPGNYKVQTKKKFPQWTDPQSGRTYPPNHPENELGTRWLGFQGASLGIHGTIHPDTIGSYASLGCVGMFKEDVEELFDFVNIGTPIKIFGEIRGKPAA